MVDFERLQEEVLRQKPDLSREALLKMVGEKKKRVGAGYLTDQGALFLVASDLGVSLDQVTASNLTLKDLSVGVNEITVVARVFTIYPLKKYVKKDGSEGHYRRLVLFDNDTFAQVTLWDEKAGTVEDLKLKPDSVVRVVKGYVRAGLDSRPVLNLGVRGSLELLVDRKITDKLPALKDITKDISNIKASETYLSVEGVITSPPKISEYVKRNGEAGKLIQLYLGRIPNNREVRVAIWNNDSPLLINLRSNSTIRLVGLRSRPLPSGEVELHGDEGTFVEVLYTPPSILSKPVIQPRVLRVLSQGFPQKTADGQFSIATLAADKDGSLFTLIARGDSARSLQDLEKDSLIECTPRESGPSTLICEADAVISPRSEDDSAYPSSSTFTYKINKIKDAATPIFLEVIALTRTIFEDIVTKDESTVKKAEVVVGDETGEVKMVAWRNLTQVLEGIMPGQRLFLRAVVSQRGRDGKLIIQARAYSSIERVS